MRAPRVLAIAAAVVVAACSAPADGRAELVRPPTPPATSGPVFPGAEWDRIDADRAGFDPARLAAADRSLAVDDTACFVVVRDGVVVHESYGAGLDESTTRAVFSVTKSVTSLLVGIAADRGELSLDDPAADYIDAWKGTPAAEVTVRDLLANVSGRRWDYQTDYEQMAFRQADKTAFSIGLEQANPPGEVWNYNNAAIQTLSAVLREATGQEPAAYAQSVLLRPLQMRSTSWGSDRAGHSTTFAGITSSCLDLARLGHLMMRGGTWKDEQVVSEDYVDQAVGGASSELNSAYGLLWWVNQRGTIRGALAALGTSADPPRRGRLAPSVPDDAFWALGFGRQVIAVVPSEGIVAVRIGAMPRDGGLEPDEFTSMVLDAQR